VKHVRFAGTDDLGNSGKSVKCRRVEEPISITLEFRALVCTRIFVPPSGAVGYGPCQRLGRNRLKNWAKRPIRIHVDSAAFSRALNSYLALAYRMALIDQGAA